MDSRVSHDAGGSDYVCLVQYCFLRLPWALVSTDERFATAISACGDRARLLHPPRHINHCPAVKRARRICWISKSLPDGGIPIFAARQWNAPTVVKLTG